MKTYIILKFPDGSISFESVNPAMNMDVYAGEAGATEYFLYETEELSGEPTDYVFDFTNKTVKRIASIEYKSEAQQKVLEYALSIENELTAGYTPGEVASWPAKLEAAYAYVAGNPNSAQKIMIETEANEKGITPLDLCNLTIIPKGEWYSEATALIASLRSNTYNAIDAAITEVEVDQILTDAMTLANQKWIDLISRMP